MEDTPTAPMSAAEQAAMDRRQKLELWKAQKEADKANLSSKSQVLPLCHPPPSRISCLPAPTGVVCGVWCVVCGVWCVVCGAWCVVCEVWCVVCGGWCVVCGVWCVV